MSCAVARSERKSEGVDRGLRRLDILEPECECLVRGRDDMELVAVRGSELLLVVLEMTLFGCASSAMADVFLSLASLSAHLVFFFFLLVATAVDR